MEEMKDEVSNIEECFESIFQVPWQKHAYYDTRCQLTKLHQCDIDVAMTDLHPQAGLWSLLTKEAPLWDQVTYSRRYLSPCASCADEMHPCTCQPTNQSSFQVSTSLRALQLLSYMRCSGLHAPGT